MTGEAPIRSLSEHKYAHFDNEQGTHMTLGIYEANGYGHDLDLLICLTLIMCFIAYEKWVPRENHG